MRRQKYLRRAIPALSWIATVAILFLAPRWVAVPSGAAPWLVLAVMGGVVAVALAVATGRINQKRRAEFDWALVAGAAPVLLLAAAGGGIGSAAGMLPACIVLAVTWRLGVRRGIESVGVLLPLMIAADVALWREVQVAAVLVTGLVITVMGVVPLTMARKAMADATRAREQMDRVQVYLAQNAGRNRRATPSDLRRERELLSEQAAVLTQLGTVDGYLRDVRDILGADEVIFWRWEESNNILRPSAWSTENEATPRHFQMREWAPLVQWAAEAKLTHCDDSAGGARIVVAPVIFDGEILGAMSATNAVGFAAGREQLRVQLARQASHVGTMLTLLDSYREFWQQRGRVEALVRAAHNIQTHTSVEALDEAICVTALEVTSGAGAALVRWSAESAGGSVVGAVGSLGSAVGTMVAEGSLVGNACLNGAPLTLGDISHVLRASPLFIGTESPWPHRTVGVCPLTRDHRVIGAVVVVGDRPDERFDAEMKNVSLLAAVAATSLEIAWEMEAVSRRAQTDPLTGLSNRRHFDEQMHRVLAETDRFGGTASLIIMDLDHFKTVNDTHGHDAGDAILRGTAAIMLEGIRSIDVCARYGGEEIVILLPQTSLQGAMELAERLRSALSARPFAWKGRAIEVTGSFGVSSYPDVARTRDAFFPSADQALYAAKREGRNCVRSEGVKALNTQP